MSVAAYLPLAAIVPVLGHLAYLQYRRKDILAAIDAGVDDIDAGAREGADDLVTLKRKMEARHAGMTLKEMGDELVALEDKYASKFENSDATKPELKAARVPVVSLANQLQKNQDPSSNPLFQRANQLAKKYEELVKSRSRSKKDTADPAPDQGADTGNASA